MKKQVYTGRLYNDNGQKLNEVIGCGDCIIADDIIMYTTKRGSREGNRIFPTLEHAKAYIEDRLNTDGSISTHDDGKTLCKSALPGLILTVVNDTDDNNGAYLVVNDDPNTTPGLRLEKIQVGAKAMAPAAPQDSVKVEIVTSIPGSLTTNTFYVVKK